MNTIYKLTRDVIVWLGPDDKQQAVKAANVLSVLPIMFDDELSVAVFTKELRSNCKQFENEEWEALPEFFIRPWVRTAVYVFMSLLATLTSIQFARVWICQEIAQRQPLIFTGAQL
jgi:hypothetical protein